MLRFFLRLRLNLLNIAILWNIKVILGGHPTRLRKFWNILKLILSKSTLRETGMLWFQLSVSSPSRISMNYFINFILTKESKITRGTNIDISKFSPRFMIQMDFSFFNVESIHGFTSVFSDICSATSYPFGFLTRIKQPPLEILKLLINTMINKDHNFIHKCG